MTTTPVSVSAPKKAAAAPAAPTVVAATATPAKAAPAPQAVVKKADANPAKAPAAAKKADPKAAAKAAPTVVVKEKKPKKPKKPKLVRDSFTIPKAEYLVLDTLKERALQLSREVKKSELLRAGIKALAALSDTALLAALSAVPTIKTGRPVADKPAAQDKPAKKVRSTKR